MITIDLKQTRKEESKMMEVLLAQYLQRSGIIDETAWPNLVEHVRFTGRGASDYDKAVRDSLIAMLWEHGAKNGTAHFLPLDQFLEHPGGNFLGTGLNEDYANPIVMLTLAQDTDMNGVALHPGWARIYKAMGLSVPLILKVSGSTNYGAKASGRPESDLLIGRATQMVEAAEYYGASALGYTYYMGSSAQPFNHRDYAEVLQAARMAALPLIVWSYPRGSEIDKVGKDSFTTVLGAVTSAINIGGDILKINFPKPLTDAQAAYLLENYKDTLSSALEWQKGKSGLDMMRQIVKVADQAGVGIIVSGGEKTNPLDVVSRVQTAMRAGTTGIINGRNVSTAEDDTVGKEKTNPLSQTQIIAETRRVLEDYPRQRTQANVTEHV
jgi:class I fructose-bisphosphate aldolase